MNQEQLQQFRAALIEACDAQVAQGNKIVSGVFFNSQGCCPITCVVGTSCTHDTSKFLSSKLGFTVNETEMWDFVDGFDGNSNLHPAGSEPLYLLGKELRQKYITQSGTP